MLCKVTLTAYVRMVHQKQYIFGCGPGLLLKLEHGTIATFRDVVDEIHQLRSGLGSLPRARCHLLVNVANTNQNRTLIQKFCCLTCDSA